MKKILFFLLFLVNPRFISANIITVSNDYLMVSLDDTDGRFMVQTIEGDISTSSDNFKPILYASFPLTSFVALNLANNVVLYGSAKGRWVTRPYSIGNKIISSWKYGDFIVAQNIEIVHNPSTGFDNKVKIYVSVNPLKDAKIGVAVVFDIKLGGKEPKAFFISDGGLISNETEIVRENLPSYWYAFDNLDEPEIRVYGDLKAGNDKLPDRVVFANWDRLSELWDLRVNSTLDFRRKGTIEFDSAVGIFYDPKMVKKGETFEAVATYGLLGANLFGEENYRLSLNLPKEPKSFPVPVVAMFLNKSEVELKKVFMELILPQGFNIVEGERMVSFFKVPPKGTIQANWSIDARNAGGSFEVKVKAKVYKEEGAEEVIEASDSFYINRIVIAKTEGDEETTGLKNIPKAKSESYEASKTSELSLEEKLKIIEEIIEKIDQSYEGWLRIYNDFFSTTNYSIEGIKQAIKEIDKELMYYQSFISNIK